jgi:hypothetical protein
VTAAIPFHRVLHADWSIKPRKRWVASAVRTNSGWRVEAPHLVGDTQAFVNELFAAVGPVLAGFDFPIGVPAAYGQLTGLENFPTALNVFGQDEWSEFFFVAETREQISLVRPFYPRVPTIGRSRNDLVQGLKVESFEVLLRKCERGTLTRRSACPLFWTLGGNQVGKAAISGWQDVIQPARQRGAELWPFEGSLAELAKSGRPVIAETYPAEAYEHVNMAFHANMSKKCQKDRRCAMAGLREWARPRRVTFSEELNARIKDGFGDRKAGEDPFDALTGILSMIEVLDGRRSEGVVEGGSANSWEGWILGQMPAG